MQDASHQFPVERSQPVQPVLLPVHLIISIEEEEQGGRCLRNDRSQCRSAYSHFRESPFTKDQDIIQEDIDDGHDHGIQRQYLGTGDSDVQGTEHDIDKGKEESPHSPGKKLISGIVDGIRGNQCPDQRSRHKVHAPRISTAIPKLKMVPCHIIGPTE